jgi:hypothetical protein
MSSVRRLAVMLAGEVALSACHGAPVGLDAIPSGAAGADAGMMSDAPAGLAAGTAGEASAQGGSADGGAALGASGAAGASGASGSGYGPPVLLDDFEAGGPAKPPVWKAFSVWQYYTYNAIRDYEAADTESPGFDSNFAEFLEFVLQDMPDGIVNNAGAGLRTITQVGTVDLSVHQNMIFDAKFQNYSPHAVNTAFLPAGTMLKVSFGCNSITSEGSADGGFAVESFVAPGPDWKTFSIPIASFTQDASQGFRIDPQKCVTLVQGIDFQFAPTLTDGQAASAKLWIDNVYFQ